MYTLSPTQGHASDKSRLAVIAAAALAIMFMCRCVASAAEPGPTARQTELLNELLTLQPDGYDGPTPWMLQVWDTDSGLTELIPLPDGPGNAASAFVQLEQLFPQEQAELAAGGEETRGVRLLLEAAAMGGCRLTPDYYPAFDSAAAKQPDFVIFRSYLQGLLKRGDSAHRAGNLTEAERCFQAAILCGKHLTDDRVSTLVYMTGIIFKLRGAQALEALWRTSGQTERADAIKRYLTGVAGTLRLLYWKANQGLSEFAGFASLPCIVRIAAADKEPCWRKEAVVRLAVLRHGVPDPDNNRLYRNPLYEQAAQDALAAIAAGDPDPSVRRMAVWAVQNVKPDMDESVVHVFE